MKKLKLQIDALEVDSFAPVGANSLRGTVRGNWFTQYARYCATDYPPGECYPTNIGCETWEAACQPTYERTCNAQSCQATCGITCGETCGNSCNGTCGGESCQSICP